MKKFRFWILMLGVLSCGLITTSAQTTKVKMSQVKSFTYKPDGVYSVFCKEGMLTDIALQPGEELLFIGGGDTTRWIVDKNLSGAGSSRRWHIYVKPLCEGITTNFIVNTDRHTYHLKMCATNWYNPVVNWNYPQEERAALFERQQRENETITFKALSLENLNFQYRISGRKYPWKPEMAFDDGTKTYLKMSAAMKSSEAPVLFIRNGKELMLVNYRVKNRYYIVDRLFDEAELRSGTKDKVKIKRIRQSEEG